MLGIERKKIEKLLDESYIYTEQLKKDIKEKTEACQYDAYYDSLTLSQEYGYQMALEEVLALCIGKGKYNDIRSITKKKDTCYTGNQSI